MLKLFLFFIAGSAIVYSMSVEAIFTALYSINQNSINLIGELFDITELLNLHTGVPANGYNFTNLTELLNIIRGANFVYELGYAQVHGVLVYAIKIGNIIYSVEPRIFHSLIYMIF